MLQTRLVIVWHLLKLLHFDLPVKAVNRQLLAVFNTILTVVCSFVFVYKALEYVLDKPDFHMVSSQLKA